MEVVDQGPYYSLINNYVTQAATSQFTQACTNKQQAKHPCLWYGSASLHLPPARILGLLGLCPLDPWVVIGMGSVTCLGYG